MRNSALVLALLTGLAAGAPAEVEKWVGLLGSDKQASPFEALNKLIELGADAAPAARKVFLDRKEPSIRRWQAVKVLGGVGAKDAVKDLLAGVEDPDPIVAACCAEALGRIKDRSVLGKLRALREKVPERVRTEVDKAIAAIEGKPPPIVAPPEEFEWIPWAATIEEALARAKKERKPVLAFVTPWDASMFESGYEGAEAVSSSRKDLNVSPMETDPGFVKERAMLAALLGHEDLSDLVAKEFVPVRVRMHTWHFMHGGNGPYADPLPRLGTKARDAHAPALLFASANGKLLHKVTSLGVFSPSLAYRTCLAVLKRTGELPVRPGEAHLFAGRHAEAAAALDGSKDARDRFHLACALSRLGRGDEARAIWTELASARGPWGARARLRLDPRAPEAREWESVQPFEGVDPLVPTTEEGPGEVGPAVAYLLDQQRDDGSWPDPGNRFLVAERFTLTVPRTAACVSALRAWRGQHGGARVDAAIEKGTAFVRSRWDGLDQVWHLTYALHLAVELGDKEAMERLAKALGAIEHDGGWTYTGPQRLHTFNTAPILILLCEAKARGAGIDDAMIARAAAFLEKNRLGKRTVFHYGTQMEHMTPKGPPGDASSCFRSPLCELALHAAAPDRGLKRIRDALDLFFEGLPGARSTTKIYESYVDPTTLQDSYRYFFGTYYAARAIRLLPDAERKPLAEKLRKTILGHQEIDGSFVDSQMVGKTSSTAFALLALAELGP
jgi:hypothetical protein